MQNTLLLIENAIKTQNSSLASMEYSTNYLQGQVNPYQGFCSLPLREVFLVTV